MRDGHFAVAARMALMVLASRVAAALAARTQDGPIAWWSCDEADGERRATDRAAGISDSIEGTFTRVPGVRGRTVRLDGFTSLIRNWWGASRL